MMEWERSEKRSLKGVADDASAGEMGMVIHKM